MLAPKRILSEPILGRVKCVGLRQVNSCTELSRPEEKTFKIFDELKIEEDNQKPKMVLWMLIDEVETMDLMAADEDKALEKLHSLLTKHGFVGLNLQFTSAMLQDALQWCITKQFDSKKTSCFLGILFITHSYFLAHPNRNQEQTYKFCRESIVLNSIESPHGDRVLGAFDSKDCLQYFCENYLPVMPLLRISLLPNYRLEVHWTPSDFKTDSMDTSARKSGLEKRRSVKKSM